MTVFEEQYWFHKKYRHLRLGITSDEVKNKNNLIKWIEESNIDEDSLLLFLQNSAFMNVLRGKFAGEYKKLQKNLQGAVDTVNEHCTEKNEPLTCEVLVNHISPSAFDAYNIREEDDNVLAMAIRDLIRFMNASVSEKLTFQDILKLLHTPGLIACCIKLYDSKNGEDEGDVGKLAKFITALVKALTDAYSGDCMELTKNGEDGCKLAKFITTLVKALTEAYSGEEESTLQDVLKLLSTGGFLGHCMKLTKNGEDEGDVSKLAEFIGAVHEGEWKNGKQHGQGKRTYAGGAVYEGERKSGISVKKKKHEESSKGSILWGKRRLT